MKIKLNTTLSLIQLGIIICLFVALVLLGGKDRTGEILQQHQLLYDKTQSEILKSRAAIAINLNRIDSLNKKLSTLSKLETAQQEDLNSILGKIKTLKNDLQTVNFSDSSSNTVFKFLTNSVSGGNN